MKTAPGYPNWILLLLCSASGIFVSSGFAQEVPAFGLGLRVTYGQASTTAPTIGTNPYQFHAVLDGTNAISSVAIGAFGFRPGTNHTFAYTSVDYADATSVTTAFAGKTYTWAITGAPASYSPSQTLASASFPSTVPALSNTNWSDGNLVIDATKDFKFTWNLFTSETDLASGNPQDIHLIIDGASGTVLDQRLLPNVTSYDLLTGAGVLTPGASYTAHLFFIDYYTWNAGLISRAIDFTSYANRTNFTIVAIPEPSTTALALGIGVLAVSLRCWRKRDTRV